MTEGNEIKIIAFSGKKRSGKNTSVDYIKDKMDLNLSLGECMKMSFATFLKSEVLNFFCPMGWNIEDLDRNKDFVLPTGRTVRQQLQWLGTDILRADWEDCHINYFKAVYDRIKDDFDTPELILVSDVRFPNEVKCIQELGGHVIRFLRNPFDDNHESEVALNAMESRSTLGWKTNDKTDVRRRFDAIIDNRNMTLDEKNKTVWQLINEKEWI